eukprot:TRINITY_DN66527_c4_g5_i1.p1 TRINITY_DN66527_c4_g5~~TRINITY_DN66527_c4_g5_i1.p1  ORF type:complete len:277 (-),score=17.52 TRINITY_DN66527_c4_g5_i1:856-1686(-)
MATKMDLGNCGGQLLWLEHMNGHKKRMQAIKPVVKMDRPWSGRTKMGKNSKKSARKPHGTHKTTHEETLVCEFDISTLSREHQGVYHELVDMLCDLGNEAARSLLEQAYRDSEERKLLNGYTGIFPSLDNEDEIEDLSDEDSDEETIDIDKDSDATSDTQSSGSRMLVPAPPTGPKPKKLASKRGTETLQSVTPSSSRSSNTSRGSRTTKTSRTSARTKSTNSTRSSNSGSTTPSTTTTNTTNTSKTETTTSTATTDSDDSTSSSSSSSSSGSSSS